MGEVRNWSGPKWEWEKAFLARGIAEGLTPTAQHVALVLSTYADGEGKGIRPSVETLVRVSGRSRATVHAALRSLRDTGWIRQIARGSGAAKRASLYELAIPGTDPRAAVP